MAWVMVLAVSMALAFAWKFALGRDERDELFRNVDIGALESARLGSRPKPSSPAAPTIAVAAVAVTDQRASAALLEAGRVREGGSDRELAERMLSRSRRWRSPRPSSLIVTSSSVAGGRSRLLQARPE
jgi:hypothetical protein